MSKVTNIKSGVRNRTIILLFLLVAFSPASLNCAPKGSGSDIVDAARSQIGKTITYDPGYQTMTYPDGDVPLDRGVCTDVVIRALRSALGIDLQKLVHEDKKNNLPKYPVIGGMNKLDKSIDHRRVPNLQTFFDRQGWSLNISNKAEDYEPGDLVTCTIPPHLPHIMIVSDRRNSGGWPLIIHNIGAGTKEEDRFFEFVLTGHYRIGRIR
jgi:uncharacterized protein YijF (DUF1287 family)